MRRRQIIQAQQAAQKAAVSFSGDANRDKAMTMLAMQKKPEDHESCPLCGRRKTGRPKK